MNNVSRPSTARVPSAVLQAPAGYVSPPAGALLSIRVTSRNLTMPLTNYGDWWNKGAEVARHACQESDRCCMRLAVLDLRRLRASTNWKPPIRPNVLAWLRREEQLHLTHIRYLFQDRARANRWRAA